MCLWEDTFTRNNRLFDGFNRPCMVLFSTVDVVVELHEVDDSECRHPIPKSIRVVGQDIKFANNFILSW